MRQLIDEAGNGSLINACADTSVEQDLEPKVREWVEKGYSDAKVREVLADSIEGYDIS